METIIIDKLQGVVVNAQWRGEISYQTKSSYIDGTPRIVDVKKNPQWVILLKDIEGIDPNVISKISELFADKEPPVSFIRKIDKDQKLLYIWLPGDSSLKITRGSKLTLSQFTISGDERGVGATYNKLTIP